MSAMSTGASRFTVMCSISGRSRRWGHSRRRVSPRRGIDQRSRPRSVRDRGRRRATRRPAGHGRAVPLGLGGRHPRRSGAVRRARLTAAGALVGASDHGTTKSLYGKDPDGIEFEIAWVVPADALDDAAIAGRVRNRAPGPRPEKARYGPTTPGGIGISRPAAVRLTCAPGLSRRPTRVRLTAGSRFR